MGLSFVHLDDTTRQSMLSEIEIDRAGGTVYVSDYLNEIGRLRWVPLLIQAAEKGTDDSLANALRRANCFKIEVAYNKPRGGGTGMRRVPVTASQTLAESQFNMYYIRALALRAIDASQGLFVYRAKTVEVPRPESEAMIGKTLDARVVLQVLRDTRGVEPSIDIPMPNTGLTVRLV
ncbi:MAG: hypothetical protein WDN46_18945 [Methylocella sp.]